MQGSGKVYRVRIQHDVPYYHRFWVECWDTTREEWQMVWRVTKHSEAMRLAHIGARLRLGWSQYEAVNPRRYRGRSIKVMLRPFKSENTGQYRAPPLP